MRSSRARTSLAIEPFFGAGDGLGWQLPGDQGQPAAALLDREFDFDVRARWHRRHGQPRPRCSTRVRLRSPACRPSPTGTWVANWNVTDSISVARGLNNAFDKAAADLPRRTCGRAPTVAVRHRRPSLVRAGADEVLTTSVSGPPGRGRQATAAPFFFLAPPVADLEFGAAVVDVQLCDDPRAGPCRSSIAGTCSVLPEHGRSAKGDLERVVEGRVTQADLGSDHRLPLLHGVGGAVDAGQRPRSPPSRRSSARRRCSSRLRRLRSSAGRCARLARRCARLDDQGYTRVSPARSGSRAPGRRERAIMTVGVEVDLQPLAGRTSTPRMPSACANAIS